MLKTLFEILDTSPNQIDRLLIQRLESRGYIVEMRGPWETVRHVCERLHISQSKFRRRMKRRPRPHPSDIDVGESGRIILIRSNVALDNFLIGPAGLTKVPDSAATKVLLKIIEPKKPKKAADRKHA